MLSDPNVKRKASLLQSSRRWQEEETPFSLAEVCQKGILQNTAAVLRVALA